MDNVRPVKIWWQYESRFGLHVILRQRLTLRSVKPIGVAQYAFDWLYPFGIVAAATSQAFFDTVLVFNLISFQTFLDQFAIKFPYTFIVLDNA